MFYVLNYNFKPEYVPSLRLFINLYRTGNNFIVMSHLYKQKTTKDALDYVWVHPETIDWKFVNSNPNPNPMLAALMDCYKKQDWEVLSANPAAASYLSTHLEELDWNAFSANPSNIALDILENYPEKINYRQLSCNTNPRAIAILRNNMSEINWDKLSSNTCDEAIALLKEYPDKIEWSFLSCNRNPEAVRMIEENIDKAFMWAVGGNVGAIRLLRNWIEVVNWPAICFNADTPEALQFIEEHLPLIGPTGRVNLSRNPYAEPLLMKYPNIISIQSVTTQKVYDIQYKYDYPGILKAKYNIHQEYHAWAGHPSRINKWKDWKINECLYPEEEEEELPFN
jgi:hypothetical protein